MSVFGQTFPLRAVARTTFRVWKLLSVRWSKTSKNTDFHKNTVNRVKMPEIEQNSAKQCQTVLQWDQTVLQWDQTVLQWVVGYPEGVHSVPPGSAPYHYPGTHYPCTTPATSAHVRAPTTATLSLVRQASLMFNTSGCSFCHFSWTPKIDKNHVFLGFSVF